jgi:hypothetical protein
MSIDKDEGHTEKNSEPGVQNNRSLPIRIGIRFRLIGIIRE